MVIDASEKGRLLARIDRHREKFGAFASKIADRGVDHGGGSVRTASGTRRRLARSVSAVVGAGSRNALTAAPAQPIAATPIAVLKS
jgi:hypothetical protein